MTLSSDGKLELTCDDVRELSGLYALHVLTPDEEATVRSHLASCPNAHAEVAELGAVSVELAHLFESHDAPAALRPRVLAAIAAEAADAERKAPSPVAAAPARAPIPMPAPVISREEERRQRRPWFAWGFAAAAVLVIAALGAWNLSLLGRAETAEQRAAAVARAIVASTEPEARVATLHGTGTAGAGSGFAAFTADGGGYILLVDLPAAPAGMTWQAWNLTDGQASSAGLLSVGSDGYALLSGVPTVAGSDAVALTLERANGASQPTSTPVVSGDLSS